MKTEANVAPTLWIRGVGPQYEQGHNEGSWLWARELLQQGKSMRCAHWQPLTWVKLCELPVCRGRRHYLSTYGASWTECSIWYEATNWEIYKTGVL